MHDNKGFVILPIIIFAVIAGAVGGIFFYKPPHPPVNIKKENNKMRELIKMYYKNQERIKTIKNIPLIASVKRNLNRAKINTAQKSLTQNSSVKLRIHKKIMPRDTVSAKAVFSNPVKVKTIYGDKDLVPTVTLSIVKKPLWKVLEKLNEKTGYYFNSKHINLAKVVSIDTEKENLAVVLNKLFGKYTIYIYPDKKEAVIEK